MSIEKKEWLDPTAEMLILPEFNAIWECIKTWDINVPEVYDGYCEATGNHVRAILDALNSMTPTRTLDKAIEKACDEIEIGIIVDRVITRWREDNQGFVEPFTLVSTAISNHIRSVFAGGGKK